ncbi:hydrogenase maturation protease [Candidatus Kryptonium thompsonii]|jgi:hydrogenase maturation protease|uniref:HyaD/HybD family hydrogenase maturation endopeptidase n=1 Tax=Candidatus Kryptonium thompsonii TaxID=1633631 RepID=UPI00063E7F0F|nr:HyaD/HybD family hydrogenase maturation endopeptidase [Candidatus Kryptonium thompsoni]CUS77200.1 hydrogenase maturation protease [Candidatus Kryptonium thompsoni]CUS78426.1 hydrogenase maturation protease [Candidatus Kryptonium thompsoni]CUS79894.1 hydrogenase maturation protease [Candidatus Kryptonium thompsoni]CUS83204.1 hydrogenase maturation protease [Candidatus Kryptonium thompsoni]CUS84342.1 hydrogenase maturation protease [Candidatus Kryptonium thompsoni]
MGKEGKVKIGILGIGNPLLGDDGFGVEVVRKLKEEIGESPDLEIIDGGSLGIYLLPYLEDKTYLIVVDVVNFGGKPGEIVKFELNKIPGFIGLKVSEHQITFHEVIALMNLLDIKPIESVLIGVQPKNNEWGAEMSDEVKGAIGKVVEKVKEQIEIWRKGNAT